MSKVVSYGCLTRTVGMKDTYVQVREAVLHDLLRSALAAVKVDEAWYRHRYLDVDQAIASGRLESARKHYMEVGYFEDRFPREFVVDQDWYLKTYSDVAKAVERKDVLSAQEHFEKAGFKEGRMPYEGWKI